MTDNLCPRCGGAIPSNERPGAYVGALSRTDNDTYVCSACGTEEALLDFATGQLPDQTHWPVTDLDGDLFDAARHRRANRPATV